MCHGQGQPPPIHQYTTPNIYLTNKQICFFYAQIVRLREHLFLFAIVMFMGCEIFRCNEIGYIILRLYYIQVVGPHRAVVRPGWLPRTHPQSTILHLVRGMGNLVDTNLYNSIYINTWIAHHRYQGKKKLQKKNVLNYQ